MTWAEPAPSPPRTPPDPVELAPGQYGVMDGWGVTNTGPFTMVLLPHDYVAPPVVHRSVFGRLLAAFGVKPAKRASASA